jgi:hypothetical protein
MKIGFDIGGVLSKYPDAFKDVIGNWLYSGSEFCDHIKIYFITDQHPKEQVVKTLIDNGFTGEWLTNNCQCRNGELEAMVYCCDYDKYGNMAKAVIISELKLDMFFDDFDGYLQWDSKFGPQPILCKIMPDAFKPYWADSWKCEGGEFGRKRYYDGNS